jgi:O-succinylbenzoate synthase
MGFWALAAELEGRPLGEMLGGCRDRVETGVTLGLEDRPEVLVARAIELWGRGYRKLKIKIRPGADAEYLSAVRQELGDHVPLAADANGSFSSSDMDTLLRLDELDLLMLEQPFDAADLRRSSALQRRIRTPVCLDETLTSIERAEDMVELKSARIANLKPGRMGGLTVALQAHDFFQASGVPVWCGGMLESGIGRAYNLALASLPNFQLPADLYPTTDYLCVDLVEPVIGMDSDGTVRVPREDPGIGVEVLRGRLEELTVRTDVVEAA